MVAKQKVYKLAPRLVRRLKGFTRTTIMAIPPGSASADNPTGLLDRRELSGGVKQRRAERWAHRRLGKLDHERRVDQIAQAIFDLTRPTHGLGAPERRLLRLAAVLHDVGRKIDDKRHPSVGAKVILKDTWLPLNDSERRCVAYLTRYHRGAVPPLGFDDLLEASDPRRKMRLVLALLRASDALDGRQLAAPRIVFALRGDGRKLAVTCYLDQLTPKARRFFKRRKKFRLLEELLNLKVDVQLERADAVRAVA